MRQLTPFTNSINRLIRRLMGYPHLYSVECLFSRHSTLLDSPSLQRCFKIPMICSSLKRLFFIASVFSNNLRENSSFDRERFPESGQRLIRRCGYRRNKINEALRTPPLAEPATPRLCYVSSFALTVSPVLLRENHDKRNLPTLKADKILG